MPTSPAPLAVFLRETRGILTQSQVVKRLATEGQNIHPQTVYRYESGRQIPTAAVLHAYSKAFDLNADELLALAAQSTPS